MKVSESWLSDWVSTTWTSDELAQKLTMAGLEVDEINPASGSFSGVVVAHVLETQAHPNAARLNVCLVDAGQAEPVQIVCGASNVRPNLKVALAQPGAQLPGGIQIQATELRGESSSGMICSSSELGLEEHAEGIMELPDDAPIGESLHTYLKLNDHILTVELTPNRADCFSMVGVAREVAALAQSKLNMPDMVSVQPSHDDAIEVDVQAPTACPAYAVRLIKQINPHAATPLWMKERLRRAGVRPIHPVVDVTQYVMLELGQPMHAFDAAKVQGQIIVRYAKAGETIELLDGQTIQLKPNTLLIADDDKPLAIAGVMGGLDSAVNDSTQDILFESAFFSPIQMAGIARQYGLSTDASQRFERGVDPKLYSKAMQRATQLLLNITAGETGPCVTVIDEPLIRPYYNEKPIRFKPSRVETLTGLKISNQQIYDILISLAFEVDGIPNEDEWKVFAPSFRFDMQLEVDLIEEVARIYGYERLESVPIRGVIAAGEQQPLDRVQFKAAQLMAHRGYSEIISYSFVDPDIQEMLFPNCMTKLLKNPLSKELSSMRLSLWPGLISALMHNASRHQSQIQCFEIGTVFQFDLKHVLHERVMLAGLLTGETGLLNWAVEQRAFDFFDAKSDIDAMGRLFNVSFEYQPDTHPALHPGQCARIYTQTKQPIGWLGALHPAVIEALDCDIKTDVLLFELDLSYILPQPIVYQGISKFPQVRRDLSLLIDSDMPVGELKKWVQITIDDATNAFKSFDVFDIYEGEQVPEGKKSVAISLAFQANDRTMTDDEINTTMSSLLEVLSKELGAIVRN